MNTLSETTEKVDNRRKDNLTPAQRTRIGRIGGNTVALNASHMRRIGCKGGMVVSRDRAHMAEIGRMGGLKNKKS